MEANENENHPNLGTVRIPNNGNGRPVGATNKITRELKEMILGALDEAGGQEYLMKQAIENPNAFMTLIGKVLPMQVKAEHSGGTSLEVRFVSS
jgi:hypothetical protein